MSFDRITPGIKSMFADGSAYLEIDIAYGAQADSINGTSYSKESSTKNGKHTFTGEIAANGNGQLILKGWCALDGGVSKYVWTADNGKTWHDCGGSPTNAYDDIITVGQQRAGTTFADAEATKKNGAFQGAGITIDLNEYAGGEEPLKILLCAVPANAVNRVVVLYTFENVIPPATAAE